MPELREIYRRKYPLLRRAKDRLRSILKEVVAKIEDRNLVRVEFRNVRIKKFSSLKRKAEKAGWSVEHAWPLCSDLIGARVVCNNIEDVYRFSELLKEHFFRPLDQFEVQDYIREPQESGYRALHVNFMLDSSEHSLDRVPVPCEVQIRSRLQDAWAELTHDDIYKRPGLPEDLRARAKDIAEVLVAADKIASDIRIRAMREISSPAPPPDMKRVSEDGLVYSFRDVFGRSPRDYSVRLALNLCDRLRITTLQEFHKLLARPKFRERVSEAYQSILGMDMEVEDVFLAGLYAVAEGEDKAIRWAKEKADGERREMDEFVKREMLGSLPHTLEDLIEELEDPRGEPDIEIWAKALETTSACMICGETIVRSSSFAETIVDHYGVSEEDADDARERIEQAILSSGVEIGGWNSESLCGYHDGQLAKDD